MTSSASSCSWRQVLVARGCRRSRRVPRRSTRTRGVAVAGEVRVVARVAAGDRVALAVGQVLEDAPAPGRSRRPRAARCARRAACRRPAGSTCGRCAGRSRGNSVLTPKAPPRRMGAGDSMRPPAARRRVDAGRAEQVEGGMATRLTYTSGTRTPELDAEFERALAAARDDAHDPLPHVVGGRARDGRRGVRARGPEPRRRRRQPRARGAARARRRGGRRRRRGAARRGARRRGRALRAAARRRRRDPRARARDGRRRDASRPASRGSSRSPRSRRRSTSSRPTADQIEEQRRLRGAARRRFVADERNRERAAPLRRLRGDRAVQLPRRARRSA